jgi:hypothetical protein
MYQFDLLEHSITGQWAKYTFWNGPITSLINTGHHNTKYHIVLRSPTLTQYNAHQDKPSLNVNVCGKRFPNSTANIQIRNAGNLATRSTHMHTSSYAVMSTTDSRLPLLSPRTPAYTTTEPSVGTKWNQTSLIKTLHILLKSEHSLYGSERSFVSWHLWHIRIATMFWQVKEDCRPRLFIYGKANVILKRRDGI